MKASTSTTVNNILEKLRLKGIPYFRVTHQYMMNQDYSAPSEWNGKGVAPQVMPMAILKKNTIWTGSPHIPSGKTLPVVRLYFGTNNSYYTDVPSSMVAELKERGASVSNKPGVGMYRNASGDVAKAFDNMHKDMFPDIYSNCDGGTNFRISDRFFNTDGDGTDGSVSDGTVNTNPAPAPATSPSGGSSWIKTALQDLANEGAKILPQLFGGKQTPPNSGTGTTNSTPPKGMSTGTIIIIAASILAIGGTVFFIIRHNSASKS